MRIARQRGPWFGKRGSFLFVVILAFVIIKGSTGGGDKGTSDSARNGSQSSIASAAEAKPTAAWIGTKVRDGEFEFVLTSMKRLGKTLASQSGMTKTAQGEFVIVRVNVTNVGNKPQTLTTMGQFLLDDKGQRFATSAANLSLTGADKFFLTNINPGSQVIGAPLLFEMTPGTKIASIELHDSMISTGVKVRLS